MPGDRRAVTRWALALLLLTFQLGTAQVERRELLEEQIGAYEELLNVRQAELDALTAELSATNTELDAQLAERDRLAGRVVALSNEQSRIRAQTRTLEQQQRDAAARIARLETQTAGLEGQLQDLIVSLHKRRSGRYAGALAQSESLFELRVRNYYLANLAEQDVTLLETFERATTELGRARAERAGRVQALGARAAELEANQQELTAAQTALESLIATLSDTRAGQLAQQQKLLQDQNSVEGELSASRGALAAELERLREAARQAALAEAARREAADAADDAAAAAADRADTDFAAEAARLERMIQGLDEPTPAAEQGFVPPFPDGVVVRPYGERGATDLWLRAPQPGTAVRAVRAGVVTSVSRITANSGYTVAVEHGSDLISAYTNLQEPPVVVFGNRVERGQILGYLGGGIVAPDILQLRMGRPQGSEIIYQDPAELLGLR